MQRITNESLLDKAVCKSAVDGCIIKSMRDDKWIQNVML